MMLCEVQMLDLRKLNALTDEIDKVNKKFHHHTPSFSECELNELIEHLQDFNKEQVYISFEASKDSPSDGLDMAIARALEVVNAFRSTHTGKSAEKNLTDLIASLLPCLQQQLGDFAEQLERWRKEAKISVNRIENVSKTKAF